jgi:carbohydrate-binding DOMON domain-containing protein
MSTQYRLVQSGKTASGGCSAGQGSSEPVAPRIYLFIYFSGSPLSLKKLVANPKSNRSCVLTDVWT